MLTTSAVPCGGAGAGKTEFLAQKAAYLLQTGLCPAPKRILAISFKRDAAWNLADRVSQRCTPAQARRFNSFTFDGFAKNLLDRFLAAVPERYRPPHSYRIVFPPKAPATAVLGTVARYRTRTDVSAASSEALQVDPADLVSGLRGSKGRRHGTST